MKRILLNLLLAPFRVAFWIWRIDRDAQECQRNIQKWQQQAAEIDREMREANGGKRGRQYQGLRGKWPSP